MRIVGGQFRGRPLAAPAHEGTRPTSDRAREAMFNILAHGVPDFELEGARVLDLFAGTGALGLEALSRGRRVLPVRRAGGGRARAHPPQRRGAGADGRHQDLPPRCDGPGTRRQKRRLHAGLPRPALRPGPGGAGARLGGRGWLARARRHRRHRGAQGHGHRPPGRLRRPRSAHLGRHAGAVRPLRRRPGLSPMAAPRVGFGKPAALSHQRLDRSRLFRARHRRPERHLRGRAADRRPPGRLDPVCHACFRRGAAGGDGGRTRRLAHRAGAAELAGRHRHHRHRGVLLRPARARGTGAWQPAPAARHPPGAGDRAGRCSHAGRIASPCSAPAWSSSASCR